MRTGGPPLNGPTGQAIIARVMTDQPRSIVSQRHTVPPQVEGATFAALEKLPADRPASAAEFAKLLEGGGTAGGGFGGASATRPGRSAPGPALPVSPPAPLAGIPPPSLPPA